MGRSSEPAIKWEAERCVAAEFIFCTRSVAVPTIQQPSHRRIAHTKKKHEYLWSRYRWLPPLPQLDLVWYSLVYRYVPQKRHGHDPTITCSSATFSKINSRWSTDMKNLKSVDFFCRLFMPHIISLLLFRSFFFFLLLSWIGFGCVCVGVFVWAPMPGLFSMAKYVYNETFIVFI